MSWNPALDPDIPIGDAVDAIETVIVPRARDLGGFEVRRALPSAARQMVGPFIFFDQMGPAEFLTGQGIDVRPHPHIGLATVTYLMKRPHPSPRQPRHRPVDRTRRGQLDGGGAGHHPFRTHRRRRARPSPHSLFGLQTWVALPKDREDDPAAFVHAPREALPELEGEGKQVRLILGTAWGETRPGAGAVARPSMPTRRWRPVRPCRCPTITRIAGSTFWRARSPWAARPSRPGGCWCSVPATGFRCARARRARGLCCWAGATMDGPRHIWWNFVASTQGADRRRQGGLARGRLGAWPVPPAAR